jgi:hypothetical protein
MYTAVGPARYAINFLTGTAFTILNVRYLADVLTHQQNEGRNFKRV